LFSEERGGAALTIPELFETSVERYAAEPWLTFEDATLSFEAAHARVGAIASAFRALGIDRKAHILATMRNSPEYLLAWLALMRLGAVLLPVNPAASASELLGFIRQVRPQLVVTDAGLRSSVDTAVAESRSDVPIADVADLERSSTGTPPWVEARPDDVAVMIPTSGTTGRSKLVMQTHRAYAMAGEGFPFWLGLNSDDRLMTSLPLFHINAPAYSVLGSLAAGAGLVLLPRFSGSRFIDWARRYSATEFNAIGAMLEILMRQPERSDDADNPLRLCYTGPSPPKKRQLEIERRFDLQIVCGYALSESPYGLIWSRGSRPFGTLGSVRQHPTLGVVNHARVLDDGRRVGAGEIGELELKNPAIMVGYFDLPEETEKVLHDGWVRTGDLVRVNADGTFTFVGRKKELIRRRGENLSPLEVEMALEAHPAVAEAAAVGVPSELSEEDVKAFVVLSDADISLTQVRDFAAGRLAPFKVPRYMEAVDELPHTATGRIAKHELALERTDSELDFETGAEEGR
jgi:crotonobetaine/carnitine-CoA ligase